MCRYVVLKRNASFTWQAWMCGIVLLSALLLTAEPAVSQELKVDPISVTRPEGTKRFVSDDKTALLADGEKLFDSLKISENGLTCKSCHYKFEQYQSSFKTPYPHAVGMAKKRAGLDAVGAEQMVQLCLTVTMDSKPLAWSSRELAALKAYVLQQQKDFIALPAKAEE